MHHVLACEPQSRFLISCKEQHYFSEVPPPLSVKSQTATPLMEKISGDFTGRMLKQRLLLACGASNQHGLSALSDSPQQPHSCMMQRSDLVQTW